MTAHFPGRGTAGLQRRCRCGGGEGPRRPCSAARVSSLRVNHLVFRASAAWVNLISIPRP